MVEGGEELERERERDSIWRSNFASWMKIRIRDLLERITRRAPALRARSIFKQVARIRNPLLSGVCSTPLAAAAAAAPAVEASAEANERTHRSADRRGCGRSHVNVFIPVHNRESSIDVYDDEMEEDGENRSVRMRRRQREWRGTRNIVCTVGPPHTATSIMNIQLGAAIAVRSNPLFISVAPTLSSHSSSYVPVYTRTQRNVDTPV